MTIGAKSLELIQFGPLVPVDVKHHPLSAASLAPEELALWGEPPSTRVTFLVDTGAPQSMIDVRLLDDLKIEPIGVFTSILTPAGVVPECPTYRVELHMHLSNGVVVMPTTVAGLHASDLLAEHRRYRGILGRSALQKTRFVYDGAAGSFSIEVVRK